jgi:hypothetical protein
VSHIAIHYHTMIIVLIIVLIQDPILGGYLALVLGEHLSMDLYFLYLVRNLYLDVGMFSKKHKSKRDGSASGSKPRYWSCTKEPWSFRKEEKGVLTGKYSATICRSGVWSDYCGYEGSDSGAARSTPFAS